MTAATRPARDPDRTRQKILKEASTAFAAKGFDGARVDAIAARCRLSKNMLYYYFGNKEGLYVAVLEAMYERLRERQPDLTLAKGNPEAAMRQLVEHTFAAFRDQPDVIRLLNDENLHKGRHVRKSKRLRALYDPLVASITQVLDDGVAQGIFRPGIDPQFLYISLSSLAYHYLSNQFTLQLALGIQLSSVTSQREWLTHIADMVICFCRFPLQDAKAVDATWLKVAS
jgi:TetR/AcrR family transcriptional regulator